MKTSAGIVFTLAFIFAGVPVFAQYEDLANLPEAPTRVGDQENITCALEGVQVIKKPRENGSKDVSVIFLLTRKPSVYFNYYDAARKAVVFDFYDTHVGESILDTIHETPITGSSVESHKIDLNRDVEGLKPDIRDVVRVALFTPYEFDYDVQEDEGVITLSFKWSGRKENRLKRQKTAFYWQFPLALAAAGGAGFAAYELWFKKSTVEKTNPLTALPSHPE